MLTRAAVEGLGGPLFFRVPMTAFTKKPHITKDHQSIFRLWGDGVCIYPGLLPKTVIDTQKKQSSYARALPLF